MKKIILIIMGIFLLSVSVYGLRLWRAADGTELYHVEVHIGEDSRVYSSQADHTSDGTAYFRNSFSLWIKKSEKDGGYGYRVHMYLDGTCIFDKKGNAKDGEYDLGVYSSSSTLSVVVDKYKDKFFPWEKDEYYSSWQAISFSLIKDNVSPAISLSSKTTIGTWYPDPDEETVPTKEWSNDNVAISVLPDDGSGSGFKPGTVCYRIGSDDFWNEVYNPIFPSILLFRAIKPEVVAGASITLDSGDFEGINTVYFIAGDNVGNFSEPAPFTIKIDKSGPDQVSSTNYNVSMENGSNTSGEPVLMGLQAGWDKVTHDNPVNGCGVAGYELSIKSLVEPDYPLSGDKYTILPGDNSVSKYIDLLPLVGNGVLSRGQTYNMGIRAYDNLGNPGIWRTKSIELPPAPLIFEGEIDWTSISAGGGSDPEYKYKININRGKEYFYNAQAADPYQFDGLRIQILSSGQIVEEILCPVETIINSTGAVPAPWTEEENGKLSFNGTLAGQSHAHNTYEYKIYTKHRDGPEEFGDIQTALPVKNYPADFEIELKNISGEVLGTLYKKYGDVKEVSPFLINENNLSYQMYSLNPDGSRRTDGKDLEGDDVEIVELYQDNALVDNLSYDKAANSGIFPIPPEAGDTFKASYYFSLGEYTDLPGGSEVSTPDYERQTTVSGNDQIVLHIDKIKPVITGLAIKKEETILSPNAVPTNELGVKLDFKAEDTGSYPSGISEVKIRNNTGTLPALFYTVTGITSPLSRLTEAERNMVKAGTAGLRIVFDETSQPGDLANISFNIDWELPDGPDGERGVSIAASDITGNFSDENGTTVVYDTTPPPDPDPLLFTRSHTDNMITVNWEAVAEAAQYVVICACPVNLIGLGAEIDVTGVAPNTAIPVTVYAVDPAGNSSVNGTVFTPYTPASPGELSQPVEAYDGEGRTYSLEWELSGGEAFNQYLEITINDENSNVSERILDVLAGGGKDLFRLQNIPPHSTVSWVLTAYSDYISPGSVDWEILDEERVTGTGSSNPEYSIVNSFPVFSANSSFSPSGGFVLPNFNFEYPSANDRDGDRIVYTIYYAVVVAQAPLNYQVYGTGVPLLSQVPYSWKLTADDGHGGIISSPEFKFTIDDTPPGLTITNEPEQDVFTNQEDIQFTAADSESGILKVIYWTSDGVVKPEDNKEAGADEDDNENSYTGRVLLHDGSYTVTLKAINGAANTATVITKTLYVDITAPVFEDQQVVVEMNQGDIPSSAGDISAYLSPGRTVTVNMFLQNEYSGFRFIHYAVEKYDGTEIIAEGTEEISLIPDLEGFSGQINKEFKWDLAGRDGDFYYLLLSLEDHAGNMSPFLKGTKPFFIDTSAPDIAELEITSGLVPGGAAFYVAGMNSTDYTLGNMEILFNTGDTDVDSDGYIEKYYALTTIPGGTGDTPDEISDWYTNWDTLKNSERLIPGKSYKVTARAENMLKLSTVVNSSEFTFDNTPPENLTITIFPAAGAMAGQEIRINSVSPGENGSPDPEVPVKEYRLKIGKTDGSGELTSLVEGNVNSELVNRTGSFAFSIPGDVDGDGNYLIDDGDYFLTLSVENTAGLQSLFRSILQIDNSPQEAVIINDSGPFESAYLSADWGHGYKYIDRVVRWDYRIIRKDNPGNPLPVTAWFSTAGTEALLAIESVAGITNGSTYYYEVRALFDDDSYSDSYISNGMYVDFTKPEFAPVDGYVTPEVTTKENIYVNWKASDSETAILRANILVESFDESNTPVSGGWKEVILENYNENSLIIDPNVFKDTIGFISGKKIFISLRLQNQSGLTETVKSGAILIDNTPPPVPLVLIPGNFIHTSRYPRATWLWGRDSGGNIIPMDDTESGIKTIMWTVTDSLVDFNPRDAVWYESREEGGVNLDDYIQANPGFVFNREHAETWNFVVKATNNANLSSLGYSRGVTYDNTAPLIKEVVLMNGNNPDTAQSITYINDTSDLHLYINAVEDVSGFNGFNATYGSWDVNGNYRIDSCLTEPDPDIEYTTPVIGEDGNEIPYLLKIESPEPEMENGEIIFFEAGVTNSTGLYTKWYSKGVMLDTGKPAVIFVNGYLSGDKLYFDWETEASFAPITGYTYQLVEAGSNPVNDWSGVITSTSVSLDTVDPQGNTLIEEGKWQLVVQACSASGAVSEIDTTAAKSPVIVLDHTPAVIENYEYTEYAANSLSFSCNGVENLSDITEYQFALGTLQNKFAFTGGEWLSVNTNAAAFAQTVEFNDILGRFNTEITDMMNVYLRIRVKNSAGLWSIETAGDPVVVDKSPALISGLYTEDYTILENEIRNVSVDLEDYESGVSAYRIAIVGNKSDIQLNNTVPVPIVLPENNWTKTMSVYTTGVSLTDGSVYYIALQVRNSAEQTVAGITTTGVWSDIAFSDPIIVDLTDPVLTYKKNGIQNPIEMIVNERSGSFDVSYEVTEDVEVVFRLLDPLGSESGEPALNLEKGSFLYNFDETAYGTYTLTADLTDLSGRTGSYPQQIRVNAPAEAGFSYNLYTANPARPFKFSVDGIPAGAEANSHNKYTVNDSDGDEIAVYEWDFDYDGVNFTADSILAEPEHSYSLLTSGRRYYTVALRVTDSGGKMSEITTTNIHVVHTSSGPLYEDEQWSGIHTVVGDIIIPEGNTLTPERGTEILMNGNPVTGYNHKILVYGKIDLNDGAVIRMADGTGELWSGIVVEGEAVMRGVYIKNARWALSLFDDAVATLEDSFFEDNLNGIQVYNNSTVIRKCTFGNNRYYGIKEDAGGNPIVLDNIFKNNGIDYYDQELAVTNVEELNNITGNSGNIKE